MAYGQKNYNEKQGINGRYTIREIGCYLTAFCNLLERFGMGVDPLTLNRIFKERGIYIDVDDGIRDDLGWQSITAYNGHIVASQVNNTGAVPPNRNSIVRIKAKNQFGTHFCLVDRIEGNTVWVVDSWDGQVRKASYYGPVSGWATYVNNTPQPVKPAPTPAYDGELITIQPGWGISHAAKAAGYPDFASESRWNAIAKLNGHNSYGSFKLAPGQRIKVGKYVAPAPQPAPQPATPPGVKLVKIQAGWGVSHALKSVGYPKEAYSNTAEWERTAALNGKALKDFVLNPGNVIKVHAEPLKVEAPAPAPAPQPAADPNVINVTIQPGWGISHAMKSIGYPKEAYSSSAEWDKVAKLNGKNLDQFKLVPGQIIKVPKYVAPEAKPAEVAPAVETPKPVEPEKPKNFKDTLDESVSGKYRSKTHAQVKDHNDNPQPDLYMPAAVTVDVLGVFEKDGTKYYLTKKSAQNGWWYGIPVDALEVVKLDNNILDDDDDNDEDFIVDMSDLDQPVDHKYSSRERLVAIVARIRGLFISFFNSVKKNKKGDK